MDNLVNCHLKHLHDKETLLLLKLLRLLFKYLIIVTNLFIFNFKICWPQIAVVLEKRQISGMRQLFENQNLCVSSSQVTLEATCSNKLTTTQRTLLGSGLLVLPPRGSLF